MTFKMRQPPTKWEIENRLKCTKYRYKDLSHTFEQYDLSYTEKCEAIEMVKQLIEKASTIHLEVNQNRYFISYRALNPTRTAYDNDVEVRYRNAVKRYKKWLIENKNSIAEYKRTMREQARIRAIRRKEAARIRKEQLALKRANDRKKRDLNLLKRLKRSMDNIQKRIGASTEIQNKHSLKSMGFGRKLDI